MQHISVRLLSTLGALGLVLAAAPYAAAAPSAPHATVRPAAALPTSWSGTTQSRVATVNALSVVPSLAGLGLSQTTARSDSQGTPRSAAAATNLAGNLAGINPGALLSSATQQAPPDAGTAVSQTLLGVGLSPVVNLAASPATARARWAGDTACTAPGDVSSSTVTTAGATGGLSVGKVRLGLTDVSLVDADVVGSQSHTGLVSQAGAGDVRSVSASGTATLTGLKLVNGLVTVNVIQSGTLTATASGRQGGSTIGWSTPVIDVTAGGSTVRLQPGVKTTVTAGTLASVSLTLGQPTAVTTSADGTRAQASVTLLSVQISALAGGLQLADIDLAPVTVSATAPAGGVQCALAAPSILTPAAGSTTSDARPVLSGTGEPGATLTVSDSSGSLASTTVAADGTWSVRPTAALASGSHTITAQQALGGLVSPVSASDTFTVQTANPTPGTPIITMPTDGSRLVTHTPVITGTGDAGDALTVVDEQGDPVLSTTVNADGSWSGTSAPLANGQHTLSATQTAGNVTSLPSNAVTVFIAVPPDAPVIASPTEGSTVTTASPAISGTGTAGDVVTVRDAGGQLVLQTTVAADGSWTGSPQKPFTNGTVQLTATQTDPTGVPSPDSAVRTFTVAVAPPAPVITSPTDGSTVPDGTPTVSGTGQAGAEVAVRNAAGDLVATAVVGADGTWTTAPSTPLPAGPVTLTATQTVDGLTSPVSAPDSFTVAAGTAPAAPVISTPADGSRTTDRTPTISGTGAAGATVTVTDGDGDQVLTATVDGNGDWSGTSMKSFAPGQVRLTATQALDGPSSAESAPDTFTVLAAAPGAPVITAPANGTVTGDSTPTLSGTGTSGASLTVSTASGVPLLTTTVGDDGTWTGDVTDLLADGTYTITATQATDGGTSAQSDPVRFTVRTALSAPTITAPADGSTTSDGTPVITGTGAPGATVTVTDTSGRIRLTATVGDGGGWSVSPLVPLADGTYTITASQSEGALTSPDSTTVTFTVQTTLPAPVIGAPANGSSTADATPTISGTGVAGATVTVRTADGDPVLTTAVGSDGTWSASPSMAFAAGQVTIRATQAKGGLVSGPSADDTFTVTAARPAAPVITAPADGSTVSDPTPTISGTGVPGATVTVTDDSGTTLVTATVGPDNRWSGAPAAPLPDGGVTVTATQTITGLTSEESGAVTFTVLRPRPAAAVITAPADASTTTDTTPTITGTGTPGDQVTVIDGSGSTLLTATVQPDSSWSGAPAQALAGGTYRISATQSTGGLTSEPSGTVTFTVLTALAAPTITTPETGTSTTDRTPVIGGTGQAGATVTVVDGAGTTVLTASVSAGGTWSGSPTAALPYGPVSLSATQSLDALTSPASATVTVTVVATAPAAPTITAPRDGTVVTDPTPAIGGTGTPGATVTVVDADGTTVLTATVDSDGTWSGSPTTPLPDGPVSLTATQTLNGVSSAPSDPQDFEVVTSLDPPGIISPVDGSTVTSTTPRLTGTGQPGATVTVRIDGTVVGTVTVADDGTWSLLPTTPLTAAEHTVSASQSLAGVTSDTATSTFTVAATGQAPAAPVITAPADGSTSTDSTPTISGTGTAGDTVRVYDGDGTLLLTATVGAGGTWSGPPAPALPDGPVTLTAVQEAGGLDSDPSAAVTVTIVTSLPAPVITSPVAGSQTADRTPVIAGTGRPGATVTVTDVSGSTVLTATVGADGRWSGSPRTALPVGSVSLRARQSALGLTSPTSTVDTFTVLAGQLDAPVITAPASGTLLTTARPVVRGTGVPGATLTLRSGNRVLLVTTVGADGTWSGTVATLPDGTSTLVATQAADGVTSQPSAPTTVRVITALPAPVISTPANGTSTRDSTPLLAGTGTPGATVTVTDAAGRVLLRTTVAADGTWSGTPALALPLGMNTLTAVQSLESLRSPASTPHTVQVLPAAGKGGTGGSGPGAGTGGTGPTGGTLGDRLPKTGADLAQLAATGAGLLLLGLLILVLGRRRPGERSRG